MSADSAGAEAAAISANADRRQSPLPMVDDGRGRGKHWEQASMAGLVPDPGGRRDLLAECDRLRLLLEVTNLLVNRRDLTELFEALSKCIGRAIPHEYASVRLSEGNEIGRARAWLVVLDGRRRPDLENRYFVVSRSSADRFSDGGDITYDIATLQVNNPTVADTLRPYGLSSFCSVPLASSRGPIGILSVASRDTKMFRPEAVTLLREACGQIAIAIENGLAYEEIRRLKDQLLSEKQYLEQEIRDTHGFREI